MTSAIMPTRDDFEDSVTLRSYLANQLRYGRLVLILGAGVSQPFGLPNWIELVKRLYRSKNAKYPPGETPERLAEHFRITFF